MYFVNKITFQIQCLFIAYSHLDRSQLTALIMSETTAIDCLPYYDTFDESDRAQAMKLVEQEMKTFAAKDYLEDQPMAGVEFAVCSELIEF